MCLSNVKTAHVTIQLSRVIQRGGVSSAPSATSSALVRRSGVADVDRHVSMAHVTHPASADVDGDNDVAYTRARRASCMRTMHDALGTMCC